MKTPSGCKHWRPKATASATQITPHSAVVPLSTVAPGAAGSDLNATVAVADDERGLGSGDRVRDSLGHGGVPTGQRLQIPQWFDRTEQYVVKQGLLVIEEYLFLHLLFCHIRNPFSTYYLQDLASQFV